MPRPPILPALDWPAVFASGLEWEAWLAAAESGEQREKLRSVHAALALEPAEAAAAAGLPRPVHVVAIAEDWCGDVVRHAPALQRLAEAAPGVRVRWITREDRPEVFARFLTNGGEAIPKFILLSEAFVECGNWGPMPAACRELIARGKACGDVPAARRKVAEAYAADPGQRVVFAELLHLLGTAACTAP